MRNNKAGFSLVELLVALSILSVVAAIIIPRFLNVREEAVAVTAKAQIKELNNQSKNWMALGGRASTATAAQILQFLAADGTSTDSTRGLSNNPCRDATCQMGSYTIGLQIDPPSSEAVTPSSDDGFHICQGPVASDGGTLSYISSGSLVYKQGNYAFWIKNTGRSNYVNFELESSETGEPLYCYLTDTARSDLMDSPAPQAPATATATMPPPSFAPPMSSSGQEL